MPVCVMLPIIQASGEIAFHGRSSRNTAAPGNGSCHLIYPWQQEADETGGLP